MSLPDPKKLSDSLKRGWLSSAEQAEIQQHLKDHPERREAWEEELGLNQLLQQLPNVPVSSNFTAQVLSEVRREAMQATSRREWAGRIRIRPLFHRGFRAHWLLKVTGLAAAFCVSMLGYQQYQAANRKQMALSVAEASKLAPGSMLELLENFDAIQRLNQVPGDTGAAQLKVDKELLAALQ
jgi:anti-sigma factor RsiW